MINQDQPQQVDPLTGVPVQQALPVQQQAQVPQVPGNELGYAKPVFNANSQVAGNGIFGDVQQRQNSVSTDFIKPKTLTTQI